MITDCDIAQAARAAYVDIDCSSPRSPSPARLSTGALAFPGGAPDDHDPIHCSTWTTSIFPASQADYVLPVKRLVRIAEGLDVGDVATVTVELIDFT